MRSFSALAFLVLPGTESASAFVRTSTKGAPSLKKNSIYTSHDYWVDQDEQQESVADLNYYVHHHVQAERRHQQQSAEHAQFQKANRKAPSEKAPKKKKTSSLHQMAHTTTAASVQPASAHEETTVAEQIKAEHASGLPRHHQVEKDDAGVDFDDMVYDDDPLHESLVHSEVDDNEAELISSEAHREQARPPKQQLLDHNTAAQPEKVVENKVGAQCLSLMHAATVHHDTKEKVERTQQQQQQQHEKVQKSATHNHKAKTSSLHDSHDYWVDDSNEQESVADMYFYQHHVQAEKKHRRQQERHERQRVFAKKAEEPAKTLLKAKEQEHLKPSSTGSSRRTQPQHPVTTRNKEQATVAEPQQQKQEKHSIYESHDYWMDKTDEQESVADFYFYSHHLQAERKHLQHEQQKRRYAPPQQHRRLRATTKHKVTWQLQEHDEADDDSPREAYHPPHKPTTAGRLQEEVQQQQQQSEDFRMVGPTPIAAAKAFETMAGPVPAKETTSNNKNSAAVEDAYDDNNMAGLRGAQSRLLRAQDERVDSILHETFHFEKETTEGRDDGDRRDLLTERGRKATIGIVAAVATAIAMILCVSLTVTLLRKRNAASQTKRMEKPSASSFFEGNDNNTERVTEEDVDEDVENDGQYSLGGYIKEAHTARTPGKKSLAAAASPAAAADISLEELPQAGIHSGRTITVSTKSSRRWASSKSVISTLTFAEEEEQADEDDGAENDEDEASYSFSNIYSLINQLMNQQELAEEKEDDETTSRRSVKSESSTTLGGSLAFYENSSVVDVVDRHRRSSRLEPQQPEQENEVAWTEFQRQSTEDSDFDDDDDASLKEYMRRNFGVLSTKAQQSPTAKRKLEL